MPFDAATVGTLALWGLAGLGVFHLIDEATRALRRAHFRRQDVRDSSNQLRFVMAADFARNKVMSRSEYEVFMIVEDEARAFRGHRVFAQTSLGEILTSRDDRAFRCINSKRVDVLVVAWNGYPVVAVEYQGGGHYQNDAAARDAVKKEALRKAGVEYVEIASAHSPNEVRRLVRTALGRADNRSMTRGPAHDFYGNAEQHSSESAGMTPWRSSPTES
jgi:hypothetical protein